jgi:glucose/arabinose dehydrogenase
LTEKLTTPSSFVWSVAVDKIGIAYLGTASPATVLQTGGRQGDKPFTLFETKDLSVQVVRFGPDGALYAATIPSGKVYRLKADAAAKQDETSATVVFDAAKLDAAATGLDAAKASDAKPETKSHYIWDMTFDAAGRLYIATGGPAAIYRIELDKTGAKPGAKPEAFFLSDEAHIRCLAWDA